MAINLASKYSDQIAEVFTRASFIKGKTAETYDLTGVKTLKVYTPITVEEVDYDRDGGLKRYGDVTEMQDVVQELTMTQDKAFTLTIDKGNNLDQNLVKNAADMLRLQLNEKSTPAADKYAFKRFVTMAGSIVESAKPTKANIISKIADASQALDDALVPDDNRYLYLTSEMYKLVCTSDEFAGVDVLARQSIAKGVCGEVFGMNVVRVPKSYLPEDVYFLVAHKDAVLMPYKIADAKVHEDPVGVSGALIEGRHYYDAYVLGAKCGGVYALVERTDHQPGQDYRVRQGALHPGRLGSALLGFRKGLRCRHCADAGDRLQDPRILRAVRRVSVRGSGRLNSNSR